MKMAEALKIMKDELRIREYSQRTIDNYLSITGRFFEYCKKQPNLTFEQYVHDYPLFLRLSRKQIPSTINLTMAAIRFFAKHVMKKEVPFSDVPRMKEPRKIPEPFTQEEIKKIFAQENNRKHLLLLQTAYYCGLRLSDIRFLKVRNLRYDNGLIHIEGGKGNKDRLVPFPDVLHDGFKQHTIGLDGDDFVFSPIGSKSPYPKRTIQMIMKNACNRSNILGRHNIHRMRHSFGAHMVQGGVNLRVIQDAMGHASPTTTMLYTRLVASDISKVRNVLTSQTMAQ